MAMEDLTPKQLYAIGMLTRHAFMSGRGRGELDRLTDEDQQAYREYSETPGFETLLGRIARETPKTES